jgi:predicted metal-dependent hydrolase
VGKRFFLPVFTKEYNAMGGIFANGLLTIKVSKELENTIKGVRQNFNKIHVKALSQIVENDCKKRMEKRSKYIKSKMHFSSHEKKPFSFYGSEIRLSFDEARLMIEESIKRKEIQPEKGAAITRTILKRIKKNRTHSTGGYTLELT